MLCIILKFLLVLHVQLVFYPFIIRFRNLGRYLFIVYPGAACTIEQGHCNTQLNAGYPGSGGIGTANICRIKTFDHELLGIAQCQIRHRT
ncbi:hypothetical protein D3C87_1498370 [compost metagenome]